MVRAGILKMRVRVGVMEKVVLEQRRWSLAFRMHTEQIGEVVRTASRCDTKNEDGLLVRHSDIESQQSIQCQLKNKA